MTTQPEALRLADELDAAPYSSPCTNNAAAELRRLHEVNTELLAALKALNDYYGMSAREQLETERAVKAAINKAERTT